MNSLLGLRDRLTAASPAARTNMLVESILRALCDELGVDESELHPRSRFEHLGVDSKRALEFKELLEEELGCPLRTTLLFDYPSPESLAAYVVSVAFGDTEGDARASGEEAIRAPQDDGAPASLESIEEQLRKKLEKYEA
ncbi:acyl carrier protein [Stigmatella sp. ncwal1]|uniref:Acyl carrier protein n=1 Tax=Stigmatella ashevillensis TaxID=2995309 RepID=A0ABT5D5F5_9BACT|nr:acyl carrier protein [Stigmatella ashevillena]MDC0708899.1 acyl carrier protein [Stigmatella ashevillena]